VRERLITDLVARAKKAAQGFGPGLCVLYHVYDLADESGQVRLYADELPGPYAGG